MRTEVEHLALYLDAPLQSWGYQSKFDRRTTLSYPTRSGIIGIVCAALGIERGDTKGLAELAGLKMHVVVFQQKGRLTDFHTVGGGWNKKVDHGSIVRKADGKVGTTVVTHREYLESARFGVVLSGIGELIERVAEALSNPRWGIWLGRKACVPASPIFQGVFDSCGAAVEAMGAVAVGEGRVADEKALRRVVVEVEQFDEGTDTLMDMPLDFKKRRFAPRRVAVDVSEGA